MNNFLAFYRLQLNKDFTFNDAARIAPYLRDLNISHVYLSPVLEASPGSTHGYDVNDFAKLSEERGGKEGFQSLCHTVQSDKNLKMVIDIVPNHMGIAGHNPYWMDILSKGRASDWWHLFDIRVEEGSKIHLPILGEDLAKMIEAGSVSYTFNDAQGIGLDVSGRFFPLNSASISQIETEAAAAGLSAQKYLETLSGSHLAETLEGQNYVLVPWTESADKLSYRRFFDVMDLIGVKVEDERVYQATHKSIQSIKSNCAQLDGVRVDHVDGLVDPQGYLEQLSQDFSDVWIEKILAPDEILPEDWKTNGTTGYEFISTLNQVMVNPEGLTKLKSYWYSKLEPRWDSFAACVTQSKEEILGTLFKSEYNRLVKLSEKAGYSATDAQIFWKGMTVSLDVYRTYGTDGAVSSSDKKRLKDAAEKARIVWGEDFSRAENNMMALLLEPKNDLEKQIRIEWQQLTGPTMAKGLEDTAHYRYNPLAALNEVGCSPDSVNGDPDFFCATLNPILKSHPNSLVTTSTHDTKRSEDARHRLYALADMADDWIKFFEDAVRTNAKHKAKNFELRQASEYFIYQAMLAVWPNDGKIDEEFISRICAYMQKSTREARTETDWLAVNAEYEENYENFIRTVLVDQDFIEKVNKFMSRLGQAGALNSLTAQTLKILSGLVPDIYQGNESWDYSLVDPDNRRQVKYDARIQALTKNPSKANSAWADLFASWTTGEVKLRLTQTLIDIRRDYLLSQTGALKMTPIKVSGADKDLFVAYHLGAKFLEDGLVVICPRYAGIWIDRMTQGKAAEARFDGLESRSLKNLLVPGVTVQDVLGNGQFPIGVFACAG